MQATHLVFGDDAPRLVLELTRRAERIELALAWATTNWVSEALLASSKVARMVIGTHLFATDPDILDRVAAAGGARVVRPDAPRLFHPKVYLFEAGDRAWALVGSHNLTGSAFAGESRPNGNDEASILLEGARDSEPYRQLQAFLSSAWQRSRPLDDAFLYAYRLQHAALSERRLSLEKELSRFVEVRQPLAGPDGKVGVSPVILSWDNFVRETKASPRHDFDRRLDIVAYTRDLFIRKRHFASFLPEERKAVAGTYQPGAKNTPLGYDWAWFGSMGASGDFSHLVNEAPELLSEALDCIPVEGDVTREDFETFRAKFTAAFHGSTRVGRYPPATRLLAMKRPDQFVAVNSRNLVPLAASFGLRKSTLRLENYWDKVILPMRLSGFWRSARPSDTVLAALWAARAAMLDAIYYQGLA